MARKAQRMNTELCNVCLPDGFKPPCVDKDIQSYFVFVDGGNQGEPPFKPTVPKGANKVKVLSIRNGDLFVPSEHLHHCSKGLRMETPSSKLPVFVLVPSIRVWHLKMKENVLTNAWDAFAKSIKIGTERGKRIPLIKNRKDKYLCIGSKANRSKHGVSAYSQGLASISLDQQEVIQKYVDECERLYSCYISGDEVARVVEGIRLTGATTFSLPGIQDWKAKYFNSIAGCHGGVVLPMHIDNGDFGMGHISIQCANAQADTILSYFCFPTLGVAVPMRAGDHLLFNPMVPHMISSNCDLKTRILPLSLYLKKDIIGLNNNKLDLTAEQKQMEYIIDLI